MANIRIGDLPPAGSELFLDDESFMHDLSNELAGEIIGGIGSIIPTPIITTIITTPPSLFCPRYPIPPSSCFCPTTPIPVPPVIEF